MASIQLLIEIGLIFLIGYGIYKEDELIELEKVIEQYIEKRKQK